MKRFFPCLLAVLVLAVSACYHKPPALKDQEPAELYQAVTAFYQFIQNKDLDSFADKIEIQSRFEDQDRYYFFLDTILPAMWARNFERNRIKQFQILSLGYTPEAESVEVEIWILSDDSLPFGKVMKFKQRWYYKYSNWYPAELKAKKATVWEKYR